MTTQQIKQRLLFIIEDANRLIQHIESGNSMQDPTAFADSGWTHLSNIQIAADSQDTESDQWKSERKHEVAVDFGEDGTMTIAAFATEPEAKAFLHEYSAKHPSRKVFIDTCTYDFFNNNR
jgi:hypothetical protein